MSAPVPIDPREIAVKLSLFAFAQNFGFEWHSTFINWLTEQLLSEFTVERIQAATLRVMKREERPWSPFGSLFKECASIELEAEKESAEAARKLRDIAEEKAARDRMEAWARLTPAERAARERESKKRAQELIRGLERKAGL